jgi:hypothetical protein
LLGVWLDEIGVCGATATSTKVCVFAFLNFGTTAASSKEIKEVDQSSRLLMRSYTRASQVFKHILGIFF